MRFRRPRCFLSRITLYRQGRYLPDPVYLIPSKYFFRNRIVEEKWTYRLLATRSYKYLTKAKIARNLIEI